MPFGYIVIAVIVWLTVLAAWFAAFRYFRRRHEELSAKDRVIGFMLAGPFFPALHSSLGPRGYRLTKRETVGLAAISAIVIAIVIGSLVKTYGDG